MASARQTILILDFGSQFTQLIARRIRERGVYSEIHPHSFDIAQIRAMAPVGIVLSGGPASCYGEGAPSVAPELYELGVPTLGICYGAQLTARLLGGQVVPADKHEYGRAHLTVRAPDGLFAGLFADLASEEPLQVWMSHGDRVERLPPGFVQSADSEHSPNAAFVDRKRQIHCVQFHPEVAHTERGAEMISNFLFQVAQCRGDWSMASFADRAVGDIRAQVGEHGRVICGLSGGVDSSVVAALVHRAIGDRLTCIFVDNGLLRAGEREHVARVFRDHFRVDLRVVDAAERFLTRLAGVSDPERKRKIIGNEFIAVFEDQASSIASSTASSNHESKFLAQGTLYPDVIESVSSKGPSAVIKSHHNVGGLPDNMRFELVEPLRELFKDEVRALGLELGLPRHMIYRQPFPGPGLAIRCLGELSADRLATLRAADAIVEQEIVAAGLYESIWQSFAVLLPVKTVGVMGDARTYEEVLAVRAVHSQDGMTADWVHLPYEVLERISSRVINEVRGINRVTYDITSKPPGTIEWE